MKRTDCRYYVGDEDCHKCLKFGTIFDCAVCDGNGILSPSKVVNKEQKQWVDRLVTSYEKMVSRIGYESPINAFYSDLQMKFEEGVMQAVQNVGIDVNKEELIKALSYDRDQYEKGYSVGHIDGFAKAEKIYAMPRTDWVPCSERLPEKNGDYLVTMQGMCKRYCRFLGFDAVRKRWGYGGVVAWKECKPYDEDET